MIHLPLTLAADPLEHVVDKPVYQVGSDLPWYLSSDGSLWIVSNATLMLLLAAVLTSLLVIPAARRITTGPRKTAEDLATQGAWANFVELVCVFLRDRMFRPVLGEDTDRFAPMLWTFFWFIWICNLLGLVPLLDWTAAFGEMIGVEIGYHGHGIGGTATQSIWVTSALALTAFLFYNGVALVRDPLGYLKHLTAGAPWFVWPIIVPVEIIGTFVKPVALAIRLFANMTGGHILLAVILGFIGQLALELGGVFGAGLAVIPLLGAMAIYILELLVGTIQAFIFTFLTCIFLGLLIAHHDEHHDEEHAHGHDEEHMTEVQEQMAAAQTMP